MLLRRPLPRWLAITALEVLFWTPFCAVPLVAKVLAGAPVLRKDIVTCVVLSLAAAAVGSYFPRLQLGYRLFLFVALGFGSLLVTGIVAAKQGSFDASVLLAIADSGSSDIAEFLARFTTADYAMAALLLLPVAALLIQAKARLFPPRRAYAGPAVLGLLALHFGIGSYRHYGDILRNNQPPPPILDIVAEDAMAYPFSYPPLQPYLSAAAAFAVHRQLAAIAQNARPVVDVKAVEPAAAKPRTYVVIVGEALARGHMHLYGYRRDTTPLLDRLAGAGDLLVYRHVITSHAITLPALSAAFRFKPGRGQDGHTLFDVLNGAGFNTYWLSNQYPYGLYEQDSGVTLLTAAAHQTFLNLPTAKDERRNFDDVLLPKFRELLNRTTEDKVIFLHLMGSHWDYQSRYPPAFDYYTTLEQPACGSPHQRQVLNEYDNSVRYNDALVAQIIGLVRAAAAESLVLYFSDHGEEVYDFRDFVGHTDEMLSPYMAKIPLVLWLSDQYRKHHAEFAAQIGEGRDRRYDTDDLLYSIADLSRLSFPGMDATRSIFSTSYVAHPRMIADRDYDGFVKSWVLDAAHAAPAPLLKCGDRMSQR